MAQIVFSATRDEIAAVEAVAEATVLQTKGVEDHAIAARLVAGLMFDNPGDRDYALGHLVGIGVVGVGVLGSVVILDVWLVRRATAVQGAARE